jgi:hypothetical protein
LHEEATLELAEEAKKEAARDHQQIDVEATGH